MESNDEQLFLYLTEKYGLFAVKTFFSFGIYTATEAPPNIDFKFDQVFHGENLYLDDKFSEPDQLDYGNYIDRETDHLRPLNLLPKLLFSKGFIEEGMKAQEYLAWCKEQVPNWPTD
jgi:hypothetical protein